MIESHIFRLWLAYDGSAYHGWQFQPGQPTIEDVLARALEKVVGHEVSLRVAGRTDSGVHAAGQVVSVCLRSRLDQRQLVLALASQLPSDIVLWRADRMPDGFDARTQSVGKQYLYTIAQGLSSNPFTGRYMWHVRKTLNVEAMHEAAQHLVGELDFESFRSANCSAAHARRYIWQINVTKQERRIEIDIRGNAFCHNMVRIMVGTLVEVGKGKLAPQDVASILAAKDRRLAGQTAKAHGLSLAQVYYPDDLSSAHIPIDAQFPRFPVTESAWPFKQHDIIYGPI